MATYNGVDFDIIMDSEWRPGWGQEPMIIERLIPYANYSDVQLAGRGNWRLSVTALLDSATADADILTLMASVGTVLRTLSDLFGAGDNYSNTMLVKAGNPRRVDGTERWAVDLDFIRKGT